MRVIAGRARSLKLMTPPGMDTRPTTDRIKETLFNMLQRGLSGCRFLDLFSGSGAIGIEALSRGASYAVFVENNRAAARCIQKNLAYTRLAADARLICKDVLSALRELEGEPAFDYPPYGCQSERRALEFLAGSSLLDGGGIVIVEASSETSFAYVQDLGFQVRKIKKYGTNMHVWIARESGDEDVDSRVPRKF